jgi:hypothetical protein
MTPSPFHPDSAGFWAPANRRQRLALVALLVLAAAMRWLGIANTDPTAVVNMPLPDDAFYYLTLARNAAAGHGLTISADGTPTSGFQPLWGLVLIATQALADLGPSFPMVTAAQMLGATLGLAAGLIVLDLVSRLSASPTLGLVAAAGFLLSPQVLKHQLNGMETSLALMAGLVLLWLNLTPEQWVSSRRYCLLAGALSGLALLSRVDLLILLGAGWLVLFALQPAILRRVAWPHYLAGLALPLSAWTLLAVSLGVSPIPESGEAVRNLTLMVRHLPLRDLLGSLQRPDLFLPFYGANLLEFSSAWVRQTPLMLPLTLPLFAAAGVERGVVFSAILAILLFGLAAGVAYHQRGTQLGRACAIWLVFTLGATLAYAFAVLGPWFYQRYTAGIAAIANLILLAALASVLFPTRWGRASTVAAALAMLAGFGALIGAGSYRWIVAGPSVVGDDGFYRAAQYIDQELPPDTRVGVFSAGLISYYAHQPIMPLDGKVHQGARQALAEGRMLRFLCQADVKYVLDWEQMIRSLVERRSEAWQPGDVQQVTLIEAAGYNDLQLVHIAPAACQRALGELP